MEFDISASALLSENISLITADSAISPANKLRAKPQTCLGDIIDALGVKSAQAQRLSSPITTWSKLRINRHRIYLLADLLANNGRGIILGFIKVGQKQLFVLDHEGNHNEMHPSCVLDFYIHESQQRKGHGLKLFRHMLNKENVDPSHLAIDRPSPKFTSFLRKHFNLWATIPQVNNFVVFDGFFKNRKDRRKNSNRGSRIMFEDDFRPLSRAFSEDIIRRNRAKYPRSITDLSLVKPFSSNGSGEFNRANQWNMQRNSGTNRFSRFAVNESMHAPSFDNMRNPPQSKQSDSANMHTTRHNDHCINNEEHGQQNEESAIRLQGQGDVRKPVDQKPPLHKVISPAMQRNSNFSAEKYGSNVLEDNNYVPHNSGANTSEDLFQAKVGHNSIRNFQYSKPSDMIAELKQKDREASAHSSRSQSMKFGSSWNVFGIPPRSIPHPRK